MCLSDVIEEQIKTKGPISFCEFMEMCLYYPELGYYNSPIEKIGSDGDYFTSPTLSPIFGELVAKQLEEMWRLLGQKPFTIIEYGAGTGALCSSILNYLKSNRKFYHDLKYCIIEKSTFMIKIQKVYLKEKVTWHQSINTIKNINGCVLSNELVDNFAVHKVVMEKELMEVYVDHKNDFYEVLKPAKRELKDYFNELGVELQKGFRAEINLEAMKWMQEIAKSLNSGYVLTIDYGNPSGELYCDYRKNGTLRCFNKHTSNICPYTDIGKQDITSHVNFSALCLGGYKNGLDYCGFTTQSRFLSALGFSAHLKEKEIVGEDYLNYLNEVFLTQTLVKDMGTKFKVLIQRKNASKQKLKGLN